MSRRNQSGNVLPHSKAVSCHRTTKLAALWTGQTRLRFPSTRHVAPNQSGNVLPHSKAVSCHRTPKLAALWTAQTRLRFPRRDMSRRN
jgi:hypothetical protein